MKKFEAWYSRSTRMGKDDIVIFFEENSMARKRIVMVEPKDPLWTVINQWKTSNSLGEVELRKPQRPNSIYNTKKSFYKDVFLAVEDLQETREHLDDKIYYFVPDFVKETTLFDLRGKAASRKFNF